MQNIWKTLWTFLAMFVASFGTIWMFLEPLGLRLGVVLFGLVATLATLATAIIFAGYHIRSLKDELGKVQSENYRLNQIVKESEESSVNCCVVQEHVPICPLGVTAMHDKMSDTIQTSIEEAKHSYKWLGLSAFNVLHNNRELFSGNQQVSFEFVTVSPTNERLLAACDEYFGDHPGALKSTELVEKSVIMMNEISQHSHQKFRIEHMNQLPTFRVIIVDEKKAFVSFYERGDDALESRQIEICDSPDAPHCMFGWFNMFYEKTLLTENVGNPEDNS